MMEIKELADVKKPEQTGGATLTDQARELRRQYKREWNRRNRDKVKAAQDRYWERKAQAMQAARDQQTDEPKAQEAG